MTERGWVPGRSWIPDHLLWVEFKVIMGYLVRYYLRINKQKKKSHEVLSIFKVTLIKIEIFKFSESVFKNKVERDRVQHPILSCRCSCSHTHKYTTWTPLQGAFYAQKRLHSSWLWGQGSLRNKHKGMKVLGEVCILTDKCIQFSILPNLTP